MLAVASGGRGHRGEVRADSRLGHRERGDQLAGGDPAQPALALALVAVAQEVGETDVVVQRDAQPEAADAGALALFADHEVQAEVLRARAAVRFGHRHAEEAPLAGEGEDLAGHDARALPFAVASLLAEHLALQKSAKARAEVFVDILEQAAPHAAPDTTDAGSSR